MGAFGRTRSMTRFRLTQFLEAPGAGPRSFAKARSAVRSQRKRSFCAESERRGDLHAEGALGADTEARNPRASDKSTVGTNKGASKAPCEKSEWVRAHEALSRLAGERAAADAEEGRWLLAALRSAAHVHLGYGIEREIPSLSLPEKAVNGSIFRLGTRALPNHTGSARGRARARR
jgi:hypothetical protein